MQNIEVERTISASPEQVWDVYTDHAGWKSWSGMKHSSLHVAGNPDKNGTGAVRCLGSYGLNAYEEILDFAPPKRMTYRVVKGVPGMTNHLGEVLFEPSGKGTRVTWRCRFDSRVPGFGSFMRIYITRFFRNALDGLARHSFPDGSS
jgi:uncharacterized protein YndB with AHSA1/START domain